jgi:cytochrome c553
LKAGALPSPRSTTCPDRQHSTYFVNALKAYKSGERKHPSMRGIAASLSDKDMADLAAYYAEAK